MNRLDFNPPPEPLEVMTGQQAEFQRMGYDGTEREDYITASVEEIADIDNLAPLLKPDTLSDIGSCVVSGYEDDDASRSEHMKKNEEAIELATLTANRRSSDPWPNASNINYPLVATASLQFSSRTYGNMIKGSNIVKMRKYGEDLKGSKAARAKRVSSWLNYSLLHRYKAWESDTDKMYYVLAITGTTYRKVAYDSIDEIVNPRFLTIEDVIINNEDQSHITDVRRISHVFDYTCNEVQSHMKSGAWYDVMLDGKYDRPYGSDSYDTESNKPEYDTKTFIEQQTFYDLDNDGYEEPYLITVEKESKTVVRIEPRFERTDVKRNQETGDIYKINPINYYVEYIFLPNPMPNQRLGIGYGMLLSETNQMINEALNSLMDAAYSQNAGGGFYKRGVRIDGEKKSGEIPSSIDQWHAVDDVDDLAINQMFMPRPTPTPSQVMFSLTQFLIDNSNRLISITDAIMGQTPPPGVPATTTVNMIEQSLQFFTAINKRLYAGLTQEFKMIYNLEGKYLKENMYREFHDIRNEINNDNNAQRMGMQGMQQQQQPQLSNNPQINVRDDFEQSGIDIVPVSDPNTASDFIKISKAQQLLQIPGLNQFESVKRVLEAMDIPDYEDLLQTPQMNQVAQSLMQYFGQLMQSGQVPQQQQMMEQISNMLQGLNPPPKDLRAEAEMEKAKADMGKVQVDAQKAQIAGREVALKERKFDTELMQLKADIFKTLAEAQKTEAEAESEEIGQQNEMYMRTLERAHNMLERIHKQDLEEERLELQRQQMIAQQQQQQQRQQQMGAQQSGQQNPTAPNRGA
jgi:chaperonin GroES